MRIDQSVACATLESGEVACWGEVLTGMPLGEEHSSAPVLVGGVTNARLAVPLGGLTCALPRPAAPQRPALCWGRGKAPEPVPGTEGARDVAEGGLGEMCFVLGSGGVSCFKQSNLRSTHVVKRVDDAVSLSQQAWRRQCAVLMSGKVACWGALEEIGLAKPAEGEAVVLAGISEASSVLHPDQGTTCVLSKSGKLACISRYQGSMNPRPERADQVSMSGPRGNRCFREGGTVSCFGRDDQPAALALPGAATDLSCSETVCCVTTADGAVHCFGNNQGGLLGDGRPLVSRLPREVPGLPPIARVVLGWRTSVAISAEGELFAWGWLRGTPQQVSTPDRVADVDIAESKILVRLRSGALGQLEERQGGFYFQREDVRFQGEILDTSVSDEGRVCAAIRGQGLSCAFFDQDKNESVVRKVPHGETVISLSAAGTICGLRADRRVACLRDVESEERALASGRSPVVAELVPGLANVRWLEAPYAGLEGGLVVRFERQASGFVLHPEPAKQGATALADGGFGWSPGCVQKEGKLHCWIGSGPIAPLALGFEPISFAGGNNHACAVSPAGKIWCWGGDDRGQLGLGRVVWSDKPMRVVGLGH